LCSHSIVSLYFMEPEVSLPHAQQLSTCPYSESSRSFHCNENNMRYEYSLKCCIMPIGLCVLAKYGLCTCKGRKLYSGRRLTHRGPVFVMNKFPFVLCVREKDYGWLSVTDSHIRSAISRHARSKHEAPRLIVHVCSASQSAQPF
jgi:hypothetical protein